MSHVRYVEHKGRRIVLLDFANVRGPDQWTVALADARRFFATLPADGSAVTVTDVTGTRYDRATVDAFKTLSSDNRPYVKAGAVVNDSAMHRAVISMIALFARRKFEVFETRQQALDWAATSGGR